MNKLPEFYESSRVGTIFYPDKAVIAAQAAMTKLPPAAASRLKIKLLIVDMQIDFCHESGALYVPGAQEDLRRLINFIYRHAEYITDIICSLDSHLPHQIFHPAWWIDLDGNHPPPFTTITHEDVIDRRWRPLLEQQWSILYTKRLKERAKKDLTIWPYHCLVGGIGHAIDPELFSAIFWHSLARNNQPIWWSKGSVPETEHYSIIRPEVLVPNNPQGGKSQELLNLLRASDRIFIAGEAEGHCVLETVEDLGEEFVNQPEILQRIFVLQDCTSPIRHSEIDYETITHKRFGELAEKGIHFVNSTDQSLF